MRGHFLLPYFFATSGSPTLRPGMAAPGPQAVRKLSGATKGKADIRLVFADARIAFNLAVTALYCRRVQFASSIAAKLH